MAKSRLSHLIRSAVGRAFEHYGEFVAKRPYPFLVCPLLLTALLATGLFRMEVMDDMRFLYSPENSESRREYAVHKEFTGDGDQSTYCSLAVESSNSSLNLLTPERADLILDINRFVLENLTFHLSGAEVHFGEDICPSIPFCPDSNRIVEDFLRAYWSQSLQSDPRVQLNYPVMMFYEARFFLPAHLYGVDEWAGQVSAVRMINLVYPIPATDAHSADAVADALETSLAAHVAARPADDGLRISMYSMRLLKREIGKNTTYTFPLLPVTVVLLVAFTVLSCMAADLVHSKPVEGLMGVCSSSLAIWSSAGLLFWLGVPYITQAAVMPFITLAIGVDDTYIILGAWQRTDPRLPVERRLGLALREAGSAITVTSLTDCLSFSIGALSRTPAIAIFCQFIAVAIAFDFLYQITFFAAVVALGGRREAARRHCFFVWRRIDCKPEAAVASPPAEHACHVQDFFGGTFSRLLCKPLTRVCVFLVYAVYLTLAIWGCSRLRPNLRPSTLLVDDSSLTHYIDLAESHIWAEGLMGRVYVNKPPDFRRGANESEEFLKMVVDLETTMYSMGRNSTQLWLREFIDGYWQFVSVDYSRFYGHLRGYVSTSFNSQWAPYLKWAPSGRDEVVRQFYFTTGFQIADWAERTSLLLEWRRIMAKYARYDALVFEDHNFYSDQVLALPDTTLQVLGAALLAMSLVCLVFISEPHVVFWVIFTLLSMDVGIAGFLSLWGAELSPTTVVNILMSIGLSVDFATHVGYRLHRTRAPTADARVAAALGSIGWPVLQGGASTFLAIVVMLAVRSHVVRMFARTTILVVGFGLFHGLVLLPVILRTIVGQPSARARLAASLSPPNTRTLSTTHQNSLPV